MTARMHAVVPWKHQNSTMVACNASCSRSDQQIHGICRQAADHSNSAMEVQASYPMYLEIDLDTISTSECKTLFGATLSEKWNAITRE